ncbi:hypothetical protein Btru_067608 [Bulinus truncatus]|nr:hypothetical protein Btru_067608 [Bulinus truncatus]
MTGYEIQQTVSRLAVVPPVKQPVHDRTQKKISQEEVKAMLDRLTKADKRKIPDSDRRVTVSDYSTMGVVCSYAWKGYN